MSEMKQEEIESHAERFSNRSLKQMGLTLQQVARQLRVDAGHRRTGNLPEEETKGGCPC